MAESDISRIRQKQAPKPSAQPDLDREMATPADDFAHLNSGRAKLRPADVLALQRTVGNAAVQRMLTGPKGVIQRDFTYKDKLYTTAELKEMSISALNELAFNMTLENATGFADAIQEVKLIVRQKQHVPQQEFGGMVNTNTMPKNLPPLPIPPQKNKLPPVPIPPQQNMPLVHNTAPKKLPTVPILPPKKEKQELELPKIVSNVQQQGFEPVIITRENAAEALHVLAEWVQYAKMQKELIANSNEYQEVKDYKSEKNEEVKKNLKPRYRKIVKEKYEPMTDSAAIVGLIHGGISKDPLPSDTDLKSLVKMTTLYLALRRSGRYEGMAAATSNQISFLAKNPHSIIAQKDDPPPTKGVARALLVEIIKRVREIERFHSQRREEEYKPEQIELSAYSQQVKKIYSLYHFQVWDKKKQEAIPRQKRVEGEDTRWHKKKHMELPLLDESKLTGQNPFTGEKVEQEKK